MVWWVGKDVTCLTDVWGRCWDAERKKSAPEGSNDEGDGGYWTQNYC